MHVQREERRQRMARKNRNWIRNRKWNRNRKVKGQHCLVRFERRKGLKESCPIYHLFFFLVSWYLNIRVGSLFFNLGLNIKQNYKKCANDYKKPFKQNSQWTSSSPRSLEPLTLLELMSCSRFYKPLASLEVIGWARSLFPLASL